MTTDRTSVILENDKKQLVRCDPKMRLHTHPQMECNCKLSSDHVIIDRHIFNALFRIHGQYVTSNASV